MSNTAIAIRDDMSLGQLGDMLAKSGYFTDARDAAQCVVKVLAGKELGFGPVASMTGVYIVKGKVSLSANLMAAAVRRSGRYTFKVVTLTPTNCEIEFFEIIGGKRESLGVSGFTLADAQKAGTQNLDKFPRNMLYARAMSNGVKWFTPDVTGGPVYTPEEMGERVNEDGEIIDAPWPQVDEKALEQDEIELVLQVNGKVRGRVTLSASLDAKAIEAAALACEEIQPFLEGKTVRKVIVVKNIVNIVVG